MNTKILFFLAFLASGLSLACCQNQLPANLLNPLEFGKSPVVSYALDEYLKENAANETAKNADAKVTNVTDETLENDSTWAILVAGSAGWDNYRYVTAW